MQGSLGERMRPVHLGLHPPRLGLIATVPQNALQAKRGVVTYLRNVQAYWVTGSQA